MAYCYECGSQVAENDLFCPYCGISVKPAGIGGSEDISMEKTMVIKTDSSTKVPETKDLVNIEKTESDDISPISANSTAEIQKIDDDEETLKEFGKSTSDFSDPITGNDYPPDTQPVENEIDQPVSETIAETSYSENGKEPAIDNESEQADLSISSTVESEIIEPQEIELLNKSSVESESEQNENISAEQSSDELISQFDSGQTDTPNNEKNVESSLNYEENEEINGNAVSDSFYGNKTEDVPIDAFDIDNIESVAEESETDIQVHIESDKELSFSDKIDENYDEKINEPETASPDDQVVKSISPVEERPDNDSSVQVVDSELVTTLNQPSQDLFEKVQADPDESEAVKSENSQTENTGNSQSEKFIQNSEVPGLMGQTIESEGEEVRISKPEIELEAAGSSKSPAVIDSVQIVRNDKIEDNIEERVAAVESENNAKPSENEESEQKESRSYTTPIVAVENTDGKKAAKLKPLDEGTVLNNRYEIVRKIGGGGMGAVYLASDKNLGGVLRAVKEMVQSYIEEVQQDKAVSDFKRESLLLTSLEHPAIPTIYDYFFDEKEMRFYLVMKYISGGDLAGRLRASSEGKIDEKTVTEWGIQIADVLDYLHNRQPPIVYRDLKPSNIMIDGNSGRLMLIDFGIARWINKEEKGVTAVGTMGYAPPELFSGNVESRSDIYSLGSTMFHLLTGADPQSNPLLIFDFQKNPFPRQINPALSDQMEKILMQTVEYNAEKRFESAAELKRVLEGHLDNLKTGKVTFGVKEISSAVGGAEQLVFCGFCGQKIISSDVFCAFCGSQQPIAQQKGLAANSYISQTATAKLTLLNLEEFETPTFSLEKETNVVGRRDPMSNIFPEVDLSKFDPQTKISRRHARIWREGNIYMVEDLGSSNGTVLMPAMSDTIRLLPHQPHILTNGDKLKVGDTTMSFTIS